ncbi:uncharacterized protein LOC142178122 [Nicotiana tabacum]|uniref:Uncharacterized protein LOC142178122 n=1 Tax=Nicotiana tabacum TaxID=4097 RepID=A0AC58U259_TOBAC
MTFVYAKCSSLERLELWDNLYYLARDMELPWVVGGDFNMTLSKEEKIGRLPAYPPESEDFAFCVNSCEHFDLRYKRQPLYLALFANIEVKHLIRTGSDHAQLLMSYCDQALQFIIPFKFLNFWTKHESFTEVIIHNWMADFTGDTFLILKKKLKRVKIALSKYSKLTYGDIFKIILQQAQAELKKYLSIEEQYWKQKAGMTWFAEGDRNTRFFHNHVNGKRQKLQLKRIQNNDGAWIDSQVLMSDAAVEIFQKHFT